MTSMTVERLLTAANDTMAKARYCWAVTVAGDGHANARPMGRLMALPGEDAWSVWFMTRRTSRKAIEIGRTGHLTVIFQHDTEEAYVTLIGRAAVVTDRAAIRARWQQRWNLFFPGGAEDENVAFLRTETERIELWAHGVSPEPFGTRAAIMERDHAGQWHEVDS